MVIIDDATGTIVVREGSNGLVPPTNGSNYHLHVDPNVPISLQLHTYSSAASQQQQQSQWPTSSSSTKRNAHDGHQLMTNIFPLMTNSPARPSNRANGNTSQAPTSSKDKDHSSYSKKDKDQSSYSRHREMHKTLEKNRRAHLRHCFEILKEELPRSEYNEKKTSHINIIRCAIRYIQHLKRTEMETESELDRLTRTKLRFQAQLAQLRDELLHESEKPKSNSHISGVDAILRVAAEEHIASNLSIDEGEQSDGDVIIEVEAGEFDDDEATTTASGKEMCKPDK